MNRTARVVSLIASLLVLPSTVSAATPAVAAGAYHVLLLMPDGTIRSWGTNTGGMLGDGTNQIHTTPVTVLETPPPNTSPSTPLSDVIAIATGQLTGYALKSDHTIWSWGSNSQGQLGDPTTNQRFTASAIPGLTNVTAIAAGQQYALALKDDGTVWMWGSNALGQKGDGTADVGESVTTPIQIVALGNNVVGIAAAGSSNQTSYAIKADGTVWAWGANQFSTLGNGSTSLSIFAPVQASILTSASMVRAGGSTTYALDTTGQLYSWGDNQFGQLGDGGTLRQATPELIASMPSVATVSGGGSHALAVRTDGTLWSWGNNNAGQLGNGTTTYSNVPIAVAGLTNIVSVSGGTFFSVAVSADGRVFTWGNNYYSQLGDGTDWDSSVPLEVFGSGFAPRTARPRFSVTPGTYNTTFNVIVTSDTPGATIHYTTNGADPTTSDPTVAAGGSVAITSTTTLKAKAWMNGMPDSNIQVATYTLKVVTPSFSPSGGTFAQTTNVTISTTTSGATIRYTTDGSTPTAASTLYSGPVALSTTGTMKAVAFKANWADSAVGSGSYTFNFGPLNTPTASPTGGTFEGQVVVTLSADSGATIRYTMNGADPTATSTPYNQPLTITTTTTLKAKAFQTDHPNSSTMTQVYTIRAATPTFTLNDGSYAPGTTLTINGDASTTLRVTLNGADPTNTDPAIPTGTSLLVGGYTIKVRAFKTNNTDSNVASATYSLTSPLGGGAVAAGSSHTVLATPDGLVYGWGLNTSGQVGDSTNTQRTTPKLIPTLTGVTKLAAGSLHTLAVTWDGRLFAWGSDGSGRLGDGGTTNQSTPQWISTISNVAAVAAGVSHSLALTANGQVYAWGAGSNGQLGLGNTSPAGTPTLITTLSNIVAIAAGDNQSFAVTSAGQLYAWGYDGGSVLGDGLATQQNSPKLITGISGVAAITSGSSHTIARLTSGAVYSWGLNSNGQLGQGNTTNRTTPTLVSGLSVGALVSAGSAFAAAVRSDGVLVGWGLNSSYQLGTTTPSQQNAPTVISGAPASVALLATGATHTVAVTPDGHIWTWGAGTNGQLGDGTSGTGVKRANPLDVFTSAGTFGGTPVPILTLAPGTYHSTQTLSVSAMNGAVVHYTTTGATPTESDPVATGTLSISQNITYGFRAFTPGLQPSAALVAAYELQPLAPTVSPVSGTYPSAQGIVLQAASGTTIRYTLDGSTPTTSSSEYGGPIAIGTPVTLTARAFETGWTTSPSLVASYSFVLGAPIINPPGGLYTTAQAVTLQAAPGALIHYTLDGSAPNGGSPTYSGPITVASSLTVRAVASAAGWADSLTNTQSYTIDSVGPVITATYFPSQNSAGWNHGPVEVSFFCTDAVTGVQSCPAPVTFNNEGAGQQVTVTATDVAGNQSSANITVNIDSTPAVVTVTSPANPSTTTNGSVSVTASVSDNLSGTSTAKCNGTTATIANGSITCDVALKKGLNLVIVQVQDIAGNVTSGSVSVTLTGTTASIQAVPSHYTLAVGETISIKVIDDFGQATTVTNWATSDTSVAGVDTSGVVLASAPGEATITATSGSLSTEVEVTVLASGSFPVGTTRWAVAPSPGFVNWNMVAMSRSDSTLFAALETMPDGQGGIAAARLRGIDAAGGETFALSVPIPAGDSVDRLIGDPFGGALVVSQQDVNHSNSGYRITRLSPEGSSWQHAADRIEGLAQAPDGTVFALVRTFTAASDDLSIRGIDGHTGTVKFDIPIKPWSYEVINGGCPSEDSLYLEGPDDAGTITIDTNGYANILVSRDTWVEERTSQDCSYYSDWTRSVRTQVLLERISMNGVATETVLADYYDPSADTTTDSLPFWESRDFIIGFKLGWEKPGSVLPDDQGGVLANWSVCRENDLLEIVNCDYRARYVNNGSPGTEFSLPTDSTELATISGSDQIAYRGGTSITAFRMTDGSTVWTGPTPGTPIAALSDGTIAVESGSQAALVGTNGVIQQGLPGISPAIMVGNSWIGLTATGFGAVIAADVQVDQMAFGLPTGNMFGQVAPSLKYDDFESLAIMVMDKYLPSTWAVHREFGGLICRTAQEKYFWSGPHQGILLPNGDHYTDLGACPAGSTRVAGYHTHPNTNRPSTADLDFAAAAENQDLIFYLDGVCRTVTRYSYMTYPNFEVIRPIPGCQP